MNAYGLEDEDDMELPDTMGSMGSDIPNVPRNPDAENNRREKMKDYLSRQKFLREGNADLSLSTLLNQAANQMGTIGGKAASSMPLAQMNQNLMAENRGLMAEEKADIDKQEKMRQYMAQKMASDKQKSAALAERKAAREGTEEYRNKMLGLKGKEISTKAGKEKEATEGERKMGAFANRAQSANDAYESYIQENPGAAALGTKDYLLGEYGGKLGSQFLSKEAKMSKQLEKEFIGAVLRPETGAAASDDEWSMYGEQYFPRGGDTPEVLARKSALRKQNIGTMRDMAGKGASPQAPSAIVSTPTTTSGGSSKPKTSVPVMGAVGAISPKDQKALDWANANPDDPRAIKIKAQLGR